MSNHTKSYQKKGFVLLYALLVTTMATAIGIMAANIATRQLSLSLISRDSHKAFYAADSAYRLAETYEGLVGGGDLEGAFEGEDVKISREDTEDNGYNKFSVLFGPQESRGHFSCASLEIDQGKITSDGFSYAKNLNTNCPPEDSARMVWRRRFTLSP